MRRAVKLSLLVALAGPALGGCHEHDQFVHACNDVHNGMTRADVDEHLTAVGGVHSSEGDTDLWVRASALGDDTCEVLFDRTGRVRIATYRDWMR